MSLCRAKFPTRKEVRWKLLFQDDTFRPRRKGGAKASGDIYFLEEEVERFRSYGPIEKKPSGILEESLCREDPLSELVRDKRSAGRNVF